MRDEGRTLSAILWEQATRHFQNTADAGIWYSANASVGSSLCDLDDRLRQGSVNSAGGVILSAIHGCEVIVCST